MVEALQERITRIYEEIIPSVTGVSALRIVDFLFTHAPITGFGSGVVVDSSGIIATNSHVVEGFERITVTTPNGESLPAEVLAEDPQWDIAFIRVEGDDFKPARLGDSDNVKIGQIVLAIGNPFGQILGGPSLTFGVVSGVKRTLRVEGKVYENMIQTDAAINPGNSGGPLVNLDGEVIGITTAVIPFAQGIGFAIPVNEVKWGLEQVRKYGRITRPWIGIFGLDVTQLVALQLGLREPGGVLVMRIVPGGPAHKAGIRPGDIILEASGKKLSGVSDLLNVLREVGPGGYAELKIYRRGALRYVRVRVEESP
ncbi:MAG: trypsin-like peptidase domain-containing protein [Infirmifilum sp.]